MKIYKFGNIPTGSIRGMQEMLQLVNDSTPKIIVLSAPTETTEHLTKIATHLFSRDTERAHDEISKLNSDSLISLTNYSTTSRSNNKLLTPSSTASVPYGTLPGNVLHRSMKKTYCRKENS